MMTLEVRRSLSEGRTEGAGNIVIRGTWLQGMIKETIGSFGGGTAFYLNGNGIRYAEDLRERIRTLIPLYRTGAPHVGQLALKTAPSAAPAPPGPRR